MEYFTLSKHCVKCILFIITPNLHKNHTGWVLIFMLFHFSVKGNET